MRVLWIFLSFLVAAPAYADIDQHCLSSCVATGKSGSECLKSCTYNITPKPKIIAPVTLEQLEAHRTFDTLQPDPGSGGILPKPPQPKAKPQVDIVCSQECLRQGLQYDYCSAQCTKKPCATNTVLCPKQQNPFAPTATH